MNLSKIRQWLYEPKVKGVNVDSDDLLLIHSSILRSKRLLRSAFDTFYSDMASLCDRYFCVSGLEVELGTGAGFFKETRPMLLTSDIRKGLNVDMELNAQELDLENNSVRCVYAINVFHHLPNPEKFFSELIRVLRVGGGCILIEPHGGFTSGFVHRHLHTDEHYDKNASGWQTSGIDGPMSGANQALAHIVFERDLTYFKKVYGQDLEIIYAGYELNALRYLLSGGLNFRQLSPSFMEGPLKFIEFCLSPFARFWSLHRITVIRKL